LPQLPNTTYSWSPGPNTGSVITGVPAGPYTVEVSDGACYNATVQVIIPGLSALNTTITASSSSPCAGTTISLAANSAGGNGPPYTYSWSAGPATPTMSVTQNV